MRQRLGIEHTRVAGPEFFAAYEFEPEAKVEDEVRVVLDAVHHQRALAAAGEQVPVDVPVAQVREWPVSFPKRRDGERASPRRRVDERIRQYVEKVAKQRAPWFSAGVKEITWCTEVVFEQRVARQFGRDRCWLAGDAAHQTGPVGVQSMNVGMAEAAALAGALRRILREKAPLSLLETVAPGVAGGMAAPARFDRRAEAGKRNQPVGAGAVRPDPVLPAGLARGPDPAGGPVGA